MKRIIRVLAVALFLVTVFCAGFLAFYKNAQKNLPKQPLVLTSAVINQPLPKSNLISISGGRILDEELRHGKIILVFMMPDCDSCNQENDFLKTVVGSRGDIRFIYVIPFGNKEELLKRAHDKYALEPFFDVGSTISRKLQLRQVPLKIFLKDGIIKRTWLDAAITSQEQNRFMESLSSL